MNQNRADRRPVPVDQELELEVVSFRAQLDQKSPLDETVREGVRRMLQPAIDAEVEAFINRHAADRRDKHERRLVVKNGSRPQREILTVVAEGYGQKIFAGCPLPVHSRHSTSGCRDRPADGD